MLEDVLKKRLIDIINTWVLEFETYKNRDTEKKLVRENTVHEITIYNQNMTVMPPIEYARSFWMTHFHACLGIVCNLPRLNAHGFSQTFKSSNEKESRSKCFHDILTKIDKEILENAYRKIKNILAEAQSYVDTWLSYQGLWEIDQQLVYNELGTDIGMWHKV